MRFLPNKTALAYWLVTALVALFMLKSAYLYFTSPAVRVECQHLGFPDWLRVEIAVAKLLGVLALLAPVGPHGKDWAYAGFTVLLVSAALAHPLAGEPAGAASGPLGLLALLAVSYGLWRRGLARA